MRTRTNATGMRRRWQLVAWLALAAVVLNPVLVAAQTGASARVAGASPLKPGDRIQVSVPGRPALDQDLVLDAAGAVEIAPVGNVKLGGLSIAEASLLLKQKLRLFYPTLDTLHIEAGRTGTVRIYVLGAVSQKGALNFEAPPTVWDVLRSIGGPGDNASLSEARVIREVDGQPEVYPLDLTGFMTGESMEAFLMEDGDTLVIPALLEGVPGVNAQVGVKVFGSVRVPTIVPITEGTRLMDVLMLAGAPTVTANKAKINWVHHDGVRNQATLVDLNEFLLLGNEAGNPLIYPGDTVNVEVTKQSWARTSLPLILGTLTAISTIALAYDNLSNK